MPTDWTAYSEILKGKLWLGSIGADVPKLRALGITHILNVTSDDPYDTSIFHTLWLPIGDTLTQSLEPTLKRAFPFLDRAFDAENARIYVHCRAGISRSASVLIAWLMARTEKSYEKCLKFVRSRRPCVCPNPSFETQLRQFEVQLLTERVKNALGLLWPYEYDQDQDASEDASAMDQDTSLV
jgi:hypothetical protein